MNKKIKITYFPVGNQIVEAKIIFLDGWYNLQHLLGMNGIPEEGVIKIELVLDASNENVFDTTEDFN